MSQCVLTLFYIKDIVIYIMSLIFLSRYFPLLQISSMWESGFTLFQMQQIDSRRLSKCLGKHSSKLYKCMFNYCLIRVENIVCKRRNCLFWAISHFVTLFLIVVCCRGVSKCLYVGKGLKTNNCEGREWWTQLKAWYELKTQNKGNFLFSFLCHWQQQAHN